jgi:hypothetical protein
MTVIETVTSPGGDLVDVVDDEPKALWGSVGPIVRALWNDGPYRDDKGEATRPLFEAARRRGRKAVNMSGINGLFNKSLGGFVEREVNGKRCYEIRLARVPKLWLDGRLDEHERIPLTVKERGAYRQVDCPLCPASMQSQNLHRHLTQVHHHDYQDSSRLVQLARQGAIDHQAPRRNALPAVIQPDEAEPESVLNDIPAIDLMTGMLSAVRRDKMVPIRALPTLQEWLAQTERVLVELARDR